MYRPFLSHTRVKLPDKLFAVAVSFFHGPDTNILFFSNLAKDEKFI